MRGGVGKREEGERELEGIQCNRNKGLESNPAYSITSPHFTRHYTVYL